MRSIRSSLDSVDRPEPVARRVSDVGGRQIRVVLYSDTSTDTDPEQLFVVSDSPITASTDAP